MIVRHIKRREFDSADAKKLSDKLPLKIKNILASRGISSFDELDYQLKNLLSPFALKNLSEAAEILFRFIKQQKFILIVGDFDCDGATSSAVMIKALKKMGAKHVDFLVPDRFKFGYGLSVKLVEHAATLKPDLIVTVDNGIANVAGVERANQLNIPVIITDHHLAPEELPKALAIVNPNQPEDEFESKNLAGVGVAFYLMLALRSLMRQENWFVEKDIEEPNLAELLDVVALGTVADVVILDKNNRILVEQGLKRIRSGLACAGIQAILQVANRDYRRCQASDLGFTVGPRLNAAGRLDNMSIGIECLLTESLNEAITFAQRLDQLNRSRRNIESEMLEQAEMDLDSYFKKNNFDSETNLDKEKKERPLSMCLFDPDWHQGVIGILASRVKDKINRPTIVFARDDESDDNNPSIKGSARSVKGVHIRDVLALIDSQHPNLIEKFGGHAMAAGLSIKQNVFQNFAEVFHETVKMHLQGAVIQDEIITDGSLEASELSLSFATELRSLGPWGQGFPEPLFDDIFLVESSRILADEHLKLILSKGNQNVDAIFFRCPESSRATVGDRIRIVYKLDTNEFRGNQSIQLMVEQLEII